MKTKFLIVPVVFSALLLASCGGSYSSDSSGTSNSYGSSNNNYGKTTDDTMKKDTNSNSQVSTLSEKDVLATVKSKLDSDVVVMLPKSIPLSSNKHYLSAMTTSSPDEYNVVFYETKSPISVNSSDLKDTAKATPLATVSGKNYATEQEAADATGHMDNVNTGMNGVDLGSGITGYSDAGAGSTFLNWAEGRWSMGIRNTTSADPQDSIDLAKKIVAKLEQETLPAPHQVGGMKLEAAPNRADGNIISWQEGKTDYIVSGFTDPLDGITITTSFIE
ncbi:hypothetical protein [Listeria grandensis]|uniref:hypothetical protein n=1 Tax=Listeria grandensis TaxID=1494963 RepID=UPI00164DEBC9|nr:hypothetical protein [Listeria grandensis]MBC6314111.1 hypothetical protein [Listeria grandensis]